MKIFLDVGANVGSSVETALNFNFDSIVAIEPSSFCVKYLKKFNSKKIKIENIGFGNKSRIVELYGAGSIGGSIYKDKPQRWERIEKVKMSEYFLKNLSPQDKIYIKINVEGAELEIIQELKLLDRFNIQSLLIYLDVIKVPSLKKYLPYVKSEISSLKIPFAFGSHSITLNSWLNEFSELKPKKDLKYFLKKIYDFELPFIRNVRRLIKPFFPRKIWIFYANLLGPNKVR